MRLTRLLLALGGLLSIFASNALGQKPDYVRWEFFGGYSAMQFDNLGGDTHNAAVDDILVGRNTLRGFNAAATYNFHKYVGATFDYSVHFREDNFSRPAGSGNIDSTIHNVLGGITIKNNLFDGPRFKPFAHALFGFAN